MRLFILLFVFIVSSACSTPPYVHKVNQFNSLIFPLSQFATVNILQLLGRLAN